MPPNTQLPVYPHSSFLLFIFSFVFSCLGKPSSFMHVVMSTAILHILLSIASENKGEKFFLVYRICLSTSLSESLRNGNFKCLLIFQPIKADFCGWNFRGVLIGWNISSNFLCKGFLADWRTKSTRMFNKEFLSVIAWEELHISFWFLIPISVVYHNAKDLYHIPYNC